MKRELLITGRILQDHSAIKKALNFIVENNGIQKRESRVPQALGCIEHVYLYREGGNKSDKQFHTSQKRHLYQ